MSVGGRLFLVILTDISAVPNDDRIWQAWTVNESDVQRETALGVGSFVPVCKSGSSNVFRDCQKLAPVIFKLKYTFSKDGGG